MPLLPILKSYITYLILQYDTLILIPSVEGIIKIAETYLSQTLLYSSTSPRKILADAYVETSYKIKRSDRQFEASVKIQMQDSQGNPHRAWHRLEHGTTDEIAKKSVKTRIARVPRTHENSIKVDRWGGFAKHNGKDKWITIQAGSTVLPAIEPRNWYDITMLEIQKKNSANRLLRIINPTVVSRFYTTPTNS